MATKKTSTFGRLINLATDKIERYLDEQEEVTRTRSQNKSMDELIKSALKDGVLSDSEKAILFKKAEELGYDQDLLAMKLEDELESIRKNREKAEKLARQREERERERAQFEEEITSRLQKLPTTNTRRCPMCGTTMGALEMSCPECGYQFDGIASSSSVAEFSDIVSAIEAKFGKDAYAVKLIQRTINAQPIQPNKTELFDWLVFAESRISSNVINKIYRDCYTGDDAFAVKFKEAYAKAYSLFPNEEVFQKFYIRKQQVVDEYNRKLKEIEEKRDLEIKKIENQVRLKKIYKFLIVLVTIGLPVLCWVYLHWILAILLTALILYIGFYVVIYVFTQKDSSDELKKSVMRNYSVAIKNLD
jgi:rubrerythrin